MKSTTDKKKETILITGCSDGSLGAALALAFHKANYRVFATARNPSKMSKLSSHGIETLTLDVLSPTSIQTCVSSINALTNGTLNILINNAGAQYNSPISDLSIPAAKDLFDLNVWAPISMIQAFLPLLLAAKRAGEKGMVVNHTSVGSISGLPFQAAYNASKAALAMFSDILRIELQAFGIKVVDLKTGGVKSNILGNLTFGVLPEGSIYEVARKEAEKLIEGRRLKELDGMFMDATEWAEGVVGDLGKEKPPHQIWRGGSAWLARIGALLPVGMFDGKLMEVTGLDEVARKIREVRGEEGI